MALTKEQFWDALTMPVERDCHNCKHIRIGAQGGQRICAMIDITEGFEYPRQCEGFMRNPNATTIVYDNYSVPIFDFWEWNEKTY